MPEKTDSLLDEYRNIPLKEWIPLPEVLDDGRSWTKIQYYHTGNNYAVAIWDGYDGELNGKPQTYYGNPDREYRKTEREILVYLDNELVERGLISEDEVM